MVQKACEVWDRFYFGLQHVGGGDLLLDGSWLFVLRFGRRIIQLSTIDLKAFCLQVLCSLRAGYVPGSGLERDWALSIGLTTALQSFFRGGPCMTWVPGRIGRGPLGIPVRSLLLRIWIILVLWWLNSLWVRK